MHKWNAIHQQRVCDIENAKRFNGAYDILHTKAKPTLIPFLSIILSVSWGSFSTVAWWRVLIRPTHYYFTLLPLSIFFPINCLFALYKLSILNLVHKSCIPNIIFSPLGRKKEHAIEVKWTKLLSLIFWIRIWNSSDRTKNKTDRCFLYF